MINSINSSRLVVCLRKCTYVCVRMHGYISCTSGYEAKCNEIKKKKKEQKRGRKETRQKEKRKRRIKLSPHLLPLCNATGVREVDS